MKTMDRLKPVAFSTVMKWLKINRNRLFIPTLGGRSYLVLTLFYDGALCVTGSTGITIRVDETMWMHSMDYIASIHRAEDTWKASYYARPFEVAPELKKLSNYGPSFPAICKAYWKNHMK